MLYTPSHFAVDQRRLAAALMLTHPFATLISHGDDTAISHLPLLLREDDERWTLLGHVARANPHWQSWGEHGRALAIFQGGDAYISPSLYSTRKAVPTWNYAVVHVQGSIEVWHDSERKEQVLKALIDRHDPPYRGQWDELDVEFREGMKNGIVAFAITVERVEAKFKLSQNRPPADRARVLQAMAAGNEKERSLAYWTGQLGDADR
jgi:transcriptional regulator